jgi:hypothetical protein
MTDTRRTGEELTPCMWFAMCDSLTDLEADHSVLGWTPVCEGCAAVVGMEVASPVAGWRVRATFKVHGWRRTETKAFMNPLKSKCLENVSIGIGIAHPDADELHLEVVSPVLAGTGWGQGDWVKSFKREEKAE